MTSLELLMLSAALGTDLFSVSVPIGMNPMRRKIIFRAAVVFALFHIVLILTGYYIGNFLGSVVERFGSYHSEYPLLVMENWASILGALVLSGLGIYMIRENLFAAEINQNKAHPLQGISLLMLAASVSIDALAAGFSMGMMDVDLVRLSFILGSVIFLIALFGLSLGRKVGHCIGGKAECIGGIVLMLLGMHILWTMLH
ncbi:manganese efflux pump MntP [Pelosinus propionicus]|uniref:Putative Mn2+ efflux pump MntP n=1 Tax=Pelosinus propionicus DSM 13327 TaxID=1123291 RepID=A0A1I4J9B2_9FIRM|nr:manganese efflux pump MntP family protein [Pelosinus propionicus]SFL63130.1 Putative Mn2+ efflux pump MntP [Pelosinus propionicus DSM 13327]